MKKLNKKKITVFNFVSLLQAFETLYRGVLLDKLKWTRILEIKAVCDGKWCFEFVNEIFMQK